MNRYPLVYRGASAAPRIAVLLWFAQVGTRTKSGPGRFILIPDSDECMETQPL